MITKTDFKKKLWFYYSQEPEIYYKFCKSLFTPYIISDSGQSFNVCQITETYFNVIINVLGKRTIITIYFHNLMLKNNDNNK